MSFLSELKNKARSVARDGLERVGITVPDIPEDDEDTSERDFLDIYFEKTQKENGGITPIFRRIAPVPEDMKQPLREMFIPYCGEDIGCRESILSWIEHREDMDFTDNGHDLTMETLKKEGLSICERAGVVRAIGENWLGSIQSIASTQKRPIVNLLRIASSQCDANTLQDWIDQMNTKLERFELSIVRVDDMDTKESLEEELYSIVTQPLPGL